MKITRHILRTLVGKAGTTTRSLTKNMNGLSAGKVVIHQGVLGIEEYHLDGIIEATQNQRLAVEFKR